MNRSGLYLIGILLLILQNVAQHHVYMWISPCCITLLFVLLTYEIHMFLSVSSGLCSCMVGVLCTVHGSLLKHVGGKIVCIFLMCFMCTSS